MSESRSDEAPPEEAAGQPPGDGPRLVRRIGYAVLVLIALIDVAALAAVGFASFNRGKEIAALQAPATPNVSPSLPVPTVSGSPTPAARLRACATPTLIGTVSSDRVAARAAPDPNAAVIGTFGKTNALDSPQVFDLLRKVTINGRTWYRALLPIRPNGTTGYIPGKHIKVTYTTYRLRVDRSKFTLTVFNGCRRIQTFAVGIGTGATPTPVGAFYLTGLFKPPDTTTIYGVSIYTLSGFSEVLTNWKLGGIIGLHGTNDPTSIGRNASHGCIRMLNRDILGLEKLLPLGTPIVIR